MKRRASRLSVAVCLSALAIWSLTSCSSAGGQPGAAESEISGPPTILAEYQARAPRKCATVKSPPSLFQATALIQCSMDGLSASGLQLTQDVKIEKGTPRKFVYNTDAELAGIDVNAMVIPLRGSYTGYFCSKVSPQFALPARAARSAL